MKKGLLALMIAGSQFSFAQLTCATATTVTTGITTVPSYTGTYIGTCDGGGSAATPKAMWYKYTATQDGEVTITSNLPQNDGLMYSDDTRINVLSTDCTATFNCVAYNDDVSATNYLSEVTFPVTAGSTYHIQWDNRWDTMGFQFQLSFTPVTCFRPEVGYYASNVTTNGATIVWDAPTAGTTPQSYDIEYGLEGFTPGTGTVVSSTTDEYTFTNLLTTGGNYEYRVRSVCGTGNISGWSTDNGLVHLAKTTPYTNSFEIATGLGNGFGGSGWSLSNSTGYAQDGTVFYYTNTSSTAASNSQLYSRALSIPAGQQVNISFYTRGYSAATTGTFKVYYNTSRSMTGAVELGAPITVSGTTYAQQVRNFVAPQSGTYYIIISNESAITAANYSLLMDNFSATTTLGTDEISLGNVSYSVYPNPTTDVLHIDTKDKVKVISIYDMSGKKVNALLEDNKVNVKHLERGSYIINIETTKGKSTQKFIKK